MDVNFEKDDIMLSLPAAELVAAQSLISTIIERMPGCILDNKMQHLKNFVSGENTDIYGKAVKCEHIVKVVT